VKAALIYLEKKVRVVLGIKLGVKIKKSLKLNQ